MNCLKAPCLGRKQCPALEAYAFAENNVLFSGATTSDAPDANIT